MSKKQSCERRNEKEVECLEREVLFDIQARKDVHVYIITVATATTAVPATAAAVAAAVAAAGQ